MTLVVASIDVGGTKIAGGLVVYDRPDAPPKVVHRVQRPTDPQRGGEAVLQSIVETANLLKTAAETGIDAEGGQIEGLCAGPLAGIGVGSAGVIDPRLGNVRFATDFMPGWTGQPLTSALREATGVPVTALGDVHAHALGEARWGTARGTHSCLCVGVGTGLGGAYVLQGQVVRGFRGAAGHIGHTMHPAAQGMPCPCGSTAHAETITSGVGISARYQGKSFTDQLDPNLMGAEIARRAAEGELEAIAVLEFAGRSLGEALGSWCNLLDPELVVLSGSVTAAGHAWRAALDEGFKSQIMGPLADTPILYAALGSDAPLVGAAEHLLDSLDIERA